MSDAAVTDVFIVTFLAGTVVSGLLLLPFLSAYAQPNHVGYDACGPAPTRVAAVCYSILFVVTFGGEAPWLAFVLQENPFVWCVVMPCFLTQHHTHALTRTITLAVFAAGLHRDGAVCVCLLASRVFPAEPESSFAPSYAQAGPLFVR